MYWQKNWTISSAILLAVGLSSCGDSSLPSSVSPGLGASLRIEIPRQFSPPVIDSDIGGVQVFLFSDISLQDSVGSTGLLSLSGNTSPSGNIDNIPPGIYFLQCRTFDRVGNLIPTLNAQIIPIDVSSAGTQVEVTCNYIDILLPVIGVAGVPEFLFVGDEVPVVISAAVAPDYTIQSVDIRNVGNSVLPPSTLSNCAGLNICAGQGSTYRAGNIVQTITTIYTVVDSIGQSASQVFQVDVLPVSGATPIPTPVLPSEIVGNWTYFASRDFVYVPDVGFSISDTPYVAGVDISLGDNGGLIISNFYRNSSGPGEASIEENILRATLPLTFGEGQLEARFVNDTLQGTVRFSSGVPGETEAELDFVMSRGPGVGGPVVAPQRFVP